MTEHEDALDFAPLSDRDVSALTVYTFRLDCDTGLTLDDPADGARRYCASAEALLHRVGGELQAHRAALRALVEADTATMEALLSGDGAPSDLAELAYMKAFDIIRALLAHIDRERS